MDFRRTMTRGAEIFVRARPWLGWLVLAGQVRQSDVDASDIIGRLLDKADPSLTAFWLDPESSPDPGLERIIDEIEPLLSAPIERLGAGDDVPRESVEVGLILMAGSDLALWTDVLGSTGAGQWVGDRLDDGSVVFAAAAAASALGELVFGEGVRECGIHGAGWLPRAAVLSSDSDPADHPDLKDYLSETDHSYALGLQPGTAVAIGPQGQVEVWSGEPPRIVLGQGWIEA
jgi:hypothetical protein